MKKNIFRIIIASIIAVLLIISCDSHVISEWAGGTSYTEVLENNGSFVYNGKHYDNLSSAVKAASEASSTEEQVITVTGGNVISRSVEITGSDVKIILDLGGKNIMFIDVTDAAVTASEEAVLTIQNGSMSLNKKDSTLAAVSVEGGAKASIKDLEINASGMTALALNGTAAGTEATIDAGSSVKGCVTAKGGVSTTTLETAANLSDVRMQGASLVVEGEGTAVVTQNDGTNEYAVSPDGLIIDNTESIEPQDVEQGYWYIIRDGILHVYGSLKEAVESLEENDTDLFLIDNETTETAVPITLNQDIKLNLNGFNTGTFNITLSDGIDLTIDGPGTFTGTISSASGTSSLTLADMTINGAVSVSGTVEADGVTFKGSISAGGEISLTGSTFNSGTTTAPAVSSTNGDISMTNVSGALGAISAQGEGKDITISNPDNASPLAVNGAVSAPGDVSATGNSEAFVTLGGNVSAGNEFEANYCNVGNGTNDNVYARVIDIDNSFVCVNALAGGKDGTTFIPADSVSIKEPDSGDLSSSVGNLCAENLTITDPYNHLYAENVVLSGDSEEESSVNGGSYLNFQNNGDAPLTIDGGLFGNFTTTAGPETCALRGGRFNALGTDFGAVVERGDELLNLVQDGGTGVSIIYSPDGITPLPESYTFEGAGGKNADFGFGYQYDDMFTLSAGFVVESGAASTLSFTDPDSYGGVFFVRLGGTLISDKDLIYEDEYYAHQLVGRITGDNKVDSFVGEEESAGPTYTYKAQVQVVFHAVGDEGTIEHNTGHRFTYNVLSEIPPAAEISPEYLVRQTQEVAGWSSSSSSSREVEIEDNAEYTFTEDCDLYAVWVDKIILSDAVAVPSGQGIVATCKLYQNDDTYTEVGTLSGTRTADRWIDDTVYYYFNSTSETAYVRGVYLENSLSQHEYAILYHSGTVAGDSYNTKNRVDNFWGVEILQAIGNYHGTTCYYFTDPDDRYHKAYKYTRNSDTEWVWSGPEERGSSSAYPTILNDSLPAFTKTT